MGALQSKPAVAAIVRPTAGREAGRLMCVTAVEGEYLLLTDGKRRKFAAPKRKKRKHVQYLGESCHSAMHRLRAGQTVTDSELRRALAAFRDREPPQEGNATGGPIRPSSARRLCDE